MYFKIPLEYEQFVLNFGTEEYLLGKALDLKAGKQKDGSYVISQSVTQFIRDNLTKVLNYVTPRNLEFALKIKYIVDNMKPSNFELITEEEARNNLYIETVQVIVTNLYISNFRVIFVI